MDKINLTICMGSSCFARGNNDNLELLEKYIEENNLQDKIELTGARCSNQCSDGPHIFINEKKYDNIDFEKIKQLISEHLKNN